jgi:hypothetical protein
MTAVTGAAWCVLILSAGASTAAQISTGIDEQASLPYWEIKDKGMSLRLVQRLPDQTRGFFLARGFSKEDVELIAQGCVFQTVFRNLSHHDEPASLSYDQRSWVIRHDNRKTGMKTREDWEKIWLTRNTPGPSRLAFKWSLFPATQTYKPGDYNWGMSTIGLASGTVFDLEVSWTQYGRTHSAFIEAVQCAPDIEMDPVDE